MTDQIDEYSEEAEEIREFADEPVAVDDGVEFYLYDTQGLFAGHERRSASAPVPPRSTLLAPPELTGDQVARWDGRAWQVLGGPPEAIEPPAPDRAELAARVDIERDRRIDAGFYFEGVRYQSRPGDRENIAGAVLIAVADPAYTTEWIAADNSVVQMDAPTLLRFGRTAADHKQALIFAARQLKDMQPIPQDYTDDKWWP